MFAQAYPQQADLCLQEHVSFVTGHFCRDLVGITDVLVCEGFRLNKGRKISPNHFQIVSTGHFHN